MVLTRFSAVRPCGAPQGVGLTRSFHFFLTVFFDPLNDGENSSQPRFNVGGEIHWVEVGASGTKLSFGFFADFGAAEEPVTGRGGCVVFLANFAAYPLFFNEFHDGGEVISKG